LALAICVSSKPQSLCHDRQQRDGRQHQRAIKRTRIVVPKGRHRPAIIDHDDRSARADVWLIGQFDPIGGQPQTGQTIKRRRDFFARHQQQRGDDGLLVGGVASPINRKIDLIRPPRRAPIHLLLEDLPQKRMRRPWQRKIAPPDLFADQTQDQPVIRRLQRRHRRRAIRLFAPQRQAIGLPQGDGIIASRPPVFWHKSENFAGPPA
jgi:hypothetical protein